MIRDWVLPVTVGAGLAVTQNGGLPNPADFKEVTAFVAFLLLVFAVGWPAMRSMRTFTPKMDEVKTAIVDNTKSNLEVAAALKALCGQVTQNHGLVVTSQNTLADRNYNAIISLERSITAWQTRVEDLLRSVSIKRRGER